MLTHEQPNQKRVLIYDRVGCSHTSTPIDIDRRAGITPAPTAKSRGLSEGGGSIGPSRPLTGSEYDRETATDGTRGVALHVLKARIGMETGDEPIQLGFDGAHNRFEEWR